MNRKFLVVALGVALMSGCSVKYRCGGAVPAMSCKNMSQTYRETGDNFVDMRDQPEDVGKKSSGRVVVVSQAQNALNAVIAGEPVLTKPQGLRIWIAPWEDKDHDLNYSWVYIRTKDSQWTILK